MSKERLCVGVDVGKDEVVVAVVGRKAVAFGTRPADLKRLMKWVKAPAESRGIHIGMEATGVYSSKIALALCAYPGVTVSVINPAQIKAYGRAVLRRTKTDRVDAQLICDFVRSQTPAAWTAPSAMQQELAALVTHTDAIRHEMQKWANRRHAHQHMTHLPAVIATSTAELVATLTQELATIEAAITRLCQSDATLADDMTIAVSIPGIGQRSAAQLLAYGGRALTQRTRRQLDAHAGLAPAERQSGTSVRGKSHIAKAGNARLRRALYMPTLVAVRYNPILKRHYDRHLERGKPKKVALTACMRKLLNILRAMLIARKPFDPAHQPLT